MRWFLLVVATVWSLSSAPSHASPGVDLWERWEAHDPASQVSVDHSAWDAILADHSALDEHGIRRVDYAAIADGSAEALNAYIAMLEATPVSDLTRDEQFAFWANLYNALTVRVIADHFPVESIRKVNISPGLFSIGPWGAELATVEGVAVTLDDIEHRILRPIWRDPRVHYAVNCAAIGCPNLNGEAFSADRLDAQLDAAGHAFVNHARGVRIDDGDLIASKIYDWFDEDFGGSEEGVIAHLLEFAEGSLKGDLESRTEIDDYEYDWSVNSLTEPGAEG